MKNGDDLFGRGPAGDIFRQVLGGSNPIEFTYRSYVNGLGVRLKGSANVLAKRIADNTAGDVPPWGYSILAADAPGAAKVLCGLLENEDLATRERGAVALGYMGAKDSGAKAALQKAVSAAQSEKERKLMEWALEKVSGP